MIRNLRQVFKETNYLGQAISELGKEELLKGVHAFTNCDTYEGRNINSLSEYDLQCALAKFLLDTK